MSCDTNACSKQTPVGTLTDQCMCGHTHVHMHTCIHTTVVCVFSNLADAFIQVLLNFRYMSCHNLWGGSKTTVLLMRLSCPTMHIVTHNITQHGTIAKVLSHRTEIQKNIYGCLLFASGRFNGGNVDHKCGSRQQDMCWTLTRHPCLISVLFMGLLVYY